MTVLKYQDRVSRCPEISGQGGLLDRVCSCPEMLCLKPEYVCYFLFRILMLFLPTETHTSMQ